MFRDSNWIQVVQDVWRSVRTGRVVCGEERIVPSTLMAPVQIHQGVPMAMVPHVRQGTVVGSWNAILLWVWESTSTSVYWHVKGWPPASLAEFNLKTSSRQAFYDISLVDGYNIAIGIFNLFNESNNQRLKDIPPNLTNPICIGSAALITDPDQAPNKYFGTNKTYPIPLEQKKSKHDVSRWCPWNLQTFPPDKPGDGVYPYPDDDISRPYFDPCYSACARSGKPEDCCSGDYNSPDKCKASEYSKSAKAICPDAYSFGSLSCGHGRSIRTNLFHSVRWSKFNIHRSRGWRIRSCFLPSRTLFEYPRHPWGSATCSGIQRLSRWSSIGFDAEHNLPWIFWWYQSDLSTLRSSTMGILTYSGGIIDPILMQYGGEWKMIDWWLLQLSLRSVSMRRYPFSTVPCKNRQILLSSFSI